MARRCLVTGGAGFIGSHIAAALIARGDAVRIADDLSTGYRHNLDVNPGAEFLEGDLADAAFSARAVEGMELVFHQAAIPSVPRSVKDPVTSNRANIDATLNVLEASRAAGVRRVVYAASSSAYGDTPVLPKHEAMPPNPQSPYALQKLVGEQYGQLFTRLYGLETVAIRYFNVFGPRQDPTSAYSGVISQFAKALLDGRPPTIYGDGGQTRDFTYIDNVVDGVLRAAEAPGASGEVMNVATGGRISLLDLFAVMKRLTGAGVEPIFAEARPGDVRDSQADIAKAKRLLGYEPVVPFEEGLRRTIAWYRDSRPSPAAAVSRA
ncbi:MAG TPA: SDR family oxidoreductase [Vicinamibacterales bacterium]